MLKLILKPRDSEATMEAWGVNSGRPVPTEGELATVPNISLYSSMNSSQDSIAALTGYRAVSHHKVSSPYHHPALHTTKHRGRSTVYLLKLRYTLVVPRE